MPRVTQRATTRIPTQVCPVVVEVCALIHDTILGPLCQIVPPQSGLMSGCLFFPAPASCSCFGNLQTQFVELGWGQAPRWLPGWLSVAPAPPAGRNYFCFVPAPSTSSALQVKPSRCHPLGSAGQQPCWHSEAFPLHPQIQGFSGQGWPSPRLCFSRLGPAIALPWTTGFPFSPT